VASSGSLPGGGCAGVALGRTVLRLVHRCRLGSAAVVGVVHVVVAVLVAGLRSSVGLFQDFGDSLHVVGMEQ